MINKNNNLIYSNKKHTHKMKTFTSALYTDTSIERAVAGCLEGIRNSALADQPFRIISMFPLAEMRQTSALDPKPTYTVTVVCLLESTEPEHLTMPLHPIKD